MITYATCPVCRREIAASDERTITCDGCGLEINISFPNKIEILKKSIAKAIKEGQKITAIKFYRNMTSAGLKESKAAIEIIMELTEELRIPF